MKVKSVTEVTREIKHVIETSLPRVQIEGEISNYKSHYSGHAYITLKDEFSQISAVMWKSNVMKLPFDIEDGMKVVCTGNITVYEKSGRYQLTIQSMEEAGKGDLQKQFEELKKELLEKGYFDDDHKQKIPLFPQTVGLVTSPTGAAIQDIISVAQRRNPNVQLILRPAQVQGNNAAKDIAEAIEEFNAYEHVDIVIIGRGGGSLEDLWAFNEKIVADAIYSSEIPIISAVGHEIDFSISDFVADARAATPSAAAELCVADRSEMMGQLLHYQDKTYNLLLKKLSISKEILSKYKSHYALKKPESVIEMKRNDISVLKSKLEDVLKSVLREKELRLELVKKQIEALSPKNVLKRGYTLIKQNGKIVHSKKKLKNVETDFSFYDGSVVKTVTEKK